jgi:hypothetical protein
MIGAVLDKMSRQSFLGRDVPCAFVAGDANLRRYVGNNPTNATDPTGEAEVKPGVVVCGDEKDFRHVFELDIAYKGTPFVDMAKFARMRIQTVHGKKLKDWNMAVPDPLTHTGPYVITNAKIDEKDFKIEAGSVTAGYNLLFITFDVSDPTGDLGIRVTEETWSYKGDLDPVFKQTEPLTPAKGNSWTVATKEKPDGKFDQTIIYVDCPTSSTITKLIKKGSANKNTEDILPQDSVFKLVQCVEVINTKTGKTLAHKLIIMQISVNKSGKLDVAFLLESDPQYKARDDYLKKKLYQ